ncbi:hypothetical protein D3C86_1175000 [compost metagenome]
MQLGAPAGQPRGVRRLPEVGDQTAQQQLLRQAHARMRRHFKSAQFQQAQPARRTVGGIQLVDAEFRAVRITRDVDQDVAQRPVDHPGRHLGALLRAAPMDFLKRQFKLVHLVVARFVDARRLAGGADEQARKQVRQRRMVDPVRQQAGQHVGAAQERAVGRRGAAQHEVVAAACARVAPVGHELFGGQARLERGLVQEFGVVHQIGPVAGRVDVDFDDAGVGRHLQHFQARVARRRIAFQHDLHLQLTRGGFHLGHQRQIVFQARQRRHEDKKQAIARLHAHGGARQPRDRFKLGGNAGGVRVWTYPWTYPRSCPWSYPRPCSRSRSGSHARPRTRRGARVLRQQLGRPRQGTPRVERIPIRHHGRVALGRPGQRVQRQAQAHRRIAREQIHALIAQEPGA